MGAKKVREVLRTTLVCGEMRAAPSGTRRKRSPSIAKCDIFEAEARSREDFGDHVGISEAAVRWRLALVAHPEVHGLGGHKSPEGLGPRELFIHRPRRRSPGEAEVKALSVPLRR
jgi:hypothetical protein